MQSTIRCIIILSFPCGPILLVVPNWRFSLVIAKGSDFLQGPSLEVITAKVHAGTHFKNNFVYLKHFYLSCLGRLQGPLFLYFIILIFPCELISSRVLNLKACFSSCDMKWTYVQVHNQTF